MRKLFFRGERVIIYICIHFLQAIKKPLSLHSRAFPFSLRRLGHLFGTEGRNRTGTESPPQDFESSASTSSATPAKSLKYSNFFKKYQFFQKKIHSQLKCPF
jgi:hypothetical protein